MNPAPIALFVYNRPGHTRRAVQALKMNMLAAESQLFIFSDGPKNDASDGNVSEVRRYIRSISGFGQIKIIERQSNMGLADSVIAGVTELCNEIGRVIVLEDDLVVSKYFLEYMNAALDLYACNDKVMQVSGYMYPVDLQADTDAIFMPFTTSWGWATWKRAWDHFDPLMQGLESLQLDAALIRKFNLNNSFDLYRMLMAQKKGEINSWAIRWYLSVFMRNGLILHPAKSLIKNVGFDDSGIHSTAMDMQFTTELSDFRAVKFPARTELAGREFELCRAFLRKINRPLFLRLKGLFREAFKISI